MASRQGIKNRIKSVSSTKQITKAMQLVAASKLRKAQEEALGPRQYVENITQVIKELANSSSASQSNLFKTNSSKTTLTIVISSDRGLAGAYNSNVVRKLSASLKDGGRYHKIISVGRYASLFVSKVNGPDDQYELDEIDEIAAYPMSVSSVDFELALPILQESIELFSSAKVSEVFVVYTDFVSTVRQETKVEKLLPIVLDEQTTESSLDKTYEPSSEVLVDYVANRYLEANLTQFILESAASEQASRMLAMKNATDNASDLIEDLTLAFNNARQAAITQELAEISAGAQAVN
ncbi:ATP synthase F1 subunit gamma [Candidatus Nomurabacteria bacterium]|nr:ATP synthase F1 subunit gamma [Candidatus Nomurabacteria bacterium]